MRLLEESQQLADRLLEQSASNKSVEDGAEEIVLMLFLSYSVYLA